MSLLLNKRTIFSGILAASSVSTLALAEPTEGFTVTPSIGYYHFDDNRNTDDHAAYSLGLGYQFNNPWAVEFTYLNADSKTNGRDVDVDQYRLDGLYSLPEFSTTKLTPYLAAGVGSEDYSKAADSTHAFVNAGGGVKYAINNNLNLRADFRLVKDVESNHLDNVTSLGVQYTFGHSSKSSSDDSGLTDTAYETQAADSQPTEAAPTETQQPAEEASNQNDAAMTQQEPAQDATQADNSAPQSTKDDTAPATPAAAAPATQMHIMVTFAKNSATVDQNVYPELSKLSDYLKAHPQTSVTIEGYTDNSGAPSYNQKLSEQRAKAIANVLVNTFEIDPSRVSAVGYGEEKPLMPNDTPAHREANRRVEAVISSSEA